MDELMCAIKKAATVGEAVKLAEDWCELNRDWDAALAENEQRELLAVLGNTACAPADKHQTRRI